MQDTEMDLHVLFRAIHDSVGANCVAVQQLSGGSNNRLYRIETREGRSLLAKKYFNDNRSRLVREYGVLTALCKRGFNEVPKPCARLDELNTGVYSFVHGRHIDSFDFTRDHITKIANFLAKMHDVTRADVSLEVPMGFMSARSLSEVIALIRGRIEAIQRRGIQSSLRHGSGLSNGSFCTRYGRIVARGGSFSATIGIDLIDDSPTPISDSHP